MALLLTALGCYGADGPHVILPEAVVPDPDPGIRRYYGYGVALDDAGAVAVVGGAYHSLEEMREAGDAFVLREVGGTWSVEATLSPTVRVPGRHFANDVAISGDGQRILVATPAATWEAGEDAAYIFVRAGDEWVEEAILARPGERSVVASVALDGTGTRAVMNGEDPAVFVRGPTGWGLEATLVPPEGHAGRERDVAISASGDRIVAAYADEGRVFVRTPAGWAWEAALPVPSPVSDVAIDDDGALVALSGSRPPGAVYVFERRGGEWSLTAQLTEPQPREQFGGSVALSGDGDRLLVVANTADVLAESSGAAYLYHRIEDDWRPGPLLVVPDRTWTGLHIALDGDGAVAVVSAASASDDPRYAVGAFRLP